MLIKDLYAKWSDHIYAVTRILIGFLLIMHATQKIGIWGDLTVAGFAGFVGIPIWVAYIQVLFELFAGLFVFFGFFTRLGATLGWIAMAAALIKVHFPAGWNPLTNGGEIALLILLSLTLICISGAVKWSLEQRIFNKELF